MTNDQFAENVKELIKDIPWGTVSMMFPKDTDKTVQENITRLVALCRGFYLTSLND